MSWDRPSKFTFPFSLIGMQFRREGVMTQHHMDPCTFCKTGGWEWRSVGRASTVMHDCVDQCADRIHSKPVCLCSQTWRVFKNIHIALIHNKFITINSRLLERKFCWETPTLNVQHSKMDLPETGSDSRHRKDNNKGTALIMILLEKPAPNVEKKLVLNVVSPVLPVCEQKKSTWRAFNI